MANGLDLTLFNQLNAALGNTKSLGIIYNPVAQTWYAFIAEVQGALPLNEGLASGATLSIAMNQLIAMVSADLAKQAQAQAAAAAVTLAQANAAAVIAGAGQATGVQQPVGT